MTDKEQPLVSCICVTHNRPALLKRAIACFEHQYYRQKELVILYQDDDRQTEAALLAYPFDKAGLVKIIKTRKQAGMHLGTLRNYAIANASGSYICQWDDDDWYHPDRIAALMNQILTSGYTAIVQEQIIIFDNKEQKAFLAYRRPWEGSLLCKKAVFTITGYPNMEQGEDTPLITTLLNRKELFVNNQNPHHYIYIYHGNNTWDYGHFKGLIHYSRPLPDIVNAIIKNILDTSPADPSAIEALNNIFLHAAAI